MSNEQHASTAPDIDALALDVARRFTEEWDPQRRASLQVAIIEAIRATHAQPAELALAGTPSSRWAADGQPDPHAGQYDCERAALMMGDMTDDELANAVFLHGNEQPTVAQLVAGALPPIAYLTAAKERIRWLSRALAAATAPQPAELAEQQGRSTIDVTDPWRGLYLPARMPAPSEYGDLTHPDIPLWPDDREDALDKLVHAQGFDFHIVAGDFTEAAMEDGDELYWQELRAWNPEAPEGEWRLAWKGDTEDGPYAWFVRPMALRPEPAALAATGKQQVGEVQGDAPIVLPPVPHGQIMPPDDRTGDYPVAHDDEAMQDYAREAVEADRAARQLGAQEPVGEVYQGSARNPQARLSKPLPIGALLYAAPPAQGIDLGQFLYLAQWVKDGCCFLQCDPSKLDSAARDLLRAIQAQEIKE